MLSQLIAPVAGLLDKWIPDADTKQKIAHEIATLSQKHAQEIAVAQIKLNTEDAKEVHSREIGDPQPDGAASLAWPLTS